MLEEVSNDFPAYNLDRFAARRFLYEDSPFLGRTLPLATAVISVCRRSQGDCRIETTNGILCFRSTTSFRVTKRDLVPGSRAQVIPSR